MARRKSAARSEAVRERRSVKINFMVTKKEAAVIDEAASGLGVTKTALLVAGASLVQQFGPASRAAGFDSVAAFLHDQMERAGEAGVLEAERDRLREESIAVLRSSQRIAEESDAVWQRAYAAEASKSDLYKRVEALERAVHRPA